MSKRFKKCVRPPTDRAETKAPSRDRDERNERADKFTTDVDDAIINPPAGAQATWPPKRLPAKP